MHIAIPTATAARCPSTSEPTDSQTHMKGSDLDCRPVRKDRMTGQSARCSFRDSAYDLVATLQLIGLFAKHPWVRIIFFNDIRVQRAMATIFTSN
jgi:hypothetical protein